MLDRDACDPHYANGLIHEGFNGGSCADPRVPLGQLPRLGVSNIKNPQLVGGLEHVLFFHILGIITPTDGHIFQRGSNHQPDKNP